MICIELVQTQMYDVLMTLIFESRRKAYTIRCHALFVKQVEEVAEMVVETVRGVDITVSPDVKIRELHKYFIFTK